MDLDTFDGIRKRLNMEDIAKPALLGVVVVLVMVAVLAAGRFSGAATASEFQVEKSPVVEEGTVQAAAEEPEPSQLYVHVSGAVVSPGLCVLDADARVADAVAAAGGFSEDAIAESVNLARPVTDGEQILVARQGESSGDALSAADANQAAAFPVGAQSSVSGGSGGSGGLVNLNTASESELMALPGIGEATAAKIVSDRQANGTFKTIDDLKRVSGIGDKKFEALAGLICV